MELTLFLSANNIVSHIKRAELKCLDKNAIQQLCIYTFIYMSVVNFLAFPKYYNIKICSRKKAKQEYCSNVQCMGICLHIR
jgi:hypothetical protein